MVGWRSRPKSMNFHSIPSLWYSSCSRMNIWKRKKDNAVMRSAGRRMGDPTMQVTAPRIEILQRKSAFRRRYDKRLKKPGTRVRARDGLDTPPSTSSQYGLNVFFAGMGSTWARKGTEKRKRRVFTCAPNRAGAAAALAADAVEGAAFHSSTERTSLFAENGN